MEPVTYDRLESVISERIDNVESSLEHTRFSHPSSVLKSILEGSGEDLLIDKFKNELVKFFEKNIFSSYFVAHMVGNPKVGDLYLGLAYKKAGSADFDTANHFSRNLNDVDSYLSKSLSGEQAFLLLANVFKAANYGAWGAQALRNSKFSSTPEIKEIATEYVKSNEEAAKEKYKEVSGDDEDFDDSVKEYLFDDDV